LSKYTAEDGTDSASDRPYTFAEAEEEASHSVPCQRVSTFSAQAILLHVPHTEDIRDHDIDKLEESSASSAL